MIEYSQIRDNLLNTVDRLSGAVRDETAESLRGVKTKLEEEAFNLVILGQFKRGKSTFINALLGESLLPTAIIPLTSVVTGGPDNLLSGSVRTRGATEFVAIPRIILRASSCASRTDSRVSVPPALSL